MTKIRKIVLADDDSDDRFFFGRALEEIDPSIELTMLKDGGDFMDLMSELPPEDQPDVIFLDINMPKKTGVECVKALRDMEGLKDKPVVIISTSIIGELKDELKKYGVNHFLAKCNYDKLQGPLKEILNKISQELTIMA